MRVIAQPAYVLHARAWRETSLLVEAFTHDFGRVGLVARGVRGRRTRLPRALLEPLQPLQLGWMGRGDLPTLTAVEPAGAPHPLQGECVLTAMYVNELLVRLTVRGDPYPYLFTRYHALLEGLPGSRPLAWSLRCFERDLLAGLGYALQLDASADTGEAIHPDRTYCYVPEQGPMTAEHEGGVVVRGSALCALATGECPDRADLAALRRLMRSLIGREVGSHGLQSWRVLAGALRAG